ncbi:hypothetical protein [Brevibacillus sp. HB1.4B]|nr:hypothetical protein [Brevibacillus sp. HB1.4B]
MARIHAAWRTSHQADLSMHPGGRTNTTLRDYWTKRVDDLDGA